MAQVNPGETTSQPQFLKAPASWRACKLWESHGPSPEHIQGDESVLPPVTSPVCSPSAPRLLSALPPPHVASPLGPWRHSPLTGKATPAREWLHHTDHSDNSPNKTMSLKPQTTMQQGCGTQSHRRGERARASALLHKRNTVPRAVTWEIHSDCTQRQGWAGRKHWLWAEHDSLLGMQPWERLILSLPVFPSVAWNNNRTQLMGLS